MHHACQEDVIGIVSLLGHVVQHGVGNPDTDGYYLLFSNTDSTSFGFTGYSDQVFPATAVNSIVFPPTPDGSGYPAVIPTFFAVFPQFTSGSLSVSPLSQVRLQFTNIHQVTVKFPSHVPHMVLKRNCA
jgi:hypothetical protein